MDWFSEDGHPVLLRQLISSVTIAATVQMCWRQRIKGSYKTGRKAYTFYSFITA